MASVGCCRGSLNASPNFSAPGSTSSNSCGSPPSRWRSIGPIMRDLVPLQHAGREQRADARQPGRPRTLPRRSDAGAFPGRKRPQWPQGCESGDKIVAIEGLAGLATSSRSIQRGAKGPVRPTDTDYALFAPIIEGDRADRPRPDGALTRGPSCAMSRCELASSISSRRPEPRGLSPAMLSVVDLFHVLTYPFLLFAAWVLHRRKREDLISSVLSLAVLLTIVVGAAVCVLPELRRAHPGVVAPPPLRSWQYLPARRNSALPVRPAATSRDRARFLCLLPILFFLHGDFYRVVFRRLHDRRRDDPARPPAPNAAERRAAADQMGAVRLLGLFARSCRSH